jgi:hypothetical protein
LVYSRTSPGDQQTQPRIGPSNASSGRDAAAMPRVGVGRQNSHGPGEAACTPRRAARSSGWPAPDSPPTLAPGSRSTSRAARVSVQLPGAKPRSRVGHCASAVVRPRHARDHAPFCARATGDASRFSWGSSAGPAGAAPARERIREIAAPRGGTRPCLPAWEVRRAQPNL